MTLLIVIVASLILFGLFTLAVCWLTSASHERWGERYWAELAPPATEDPGEWTGPLHGGRSFARRMMTDLKAKGIMLPSRTSAATRRFVHAVDGARRPGWMLRHRLRPMRRAVFTAPVVEPPLEPLPEPPAVPAPELHTAPLPEVFEHGLIDATDLGLLVNGSDLPPAPGPGGASPIGDALTAEMGIVPQPRDEDDLAAPWYAPDSAWTVEDAERYLASPVDGDADADTEYPDWKTGQFAALAQDGEVAS